MIAAVPVPLANSCIVDSLLLQMHHQNTLNRRTYAWQNIRTRQFLLTKPVRVTRSISRILKAYTSALNLEEGTEMARDVLRLTLCVMKERGITPPSPSDIHALSVGPNDSLALIYCEMIE